jgi:hypothetical protein
VLFNAGVQVPVTPFVDVVGSAESGEPKQIAGTASKVGVIAGLTLMVNVVGLAH